MDTTSGIKLPSVSTIGIIAWISGFITIVLSLMVQIFAVDHGTSGQLSIGSRMNVALWPGILGASLIAVGFLLWTLFDSDDRNKYFYLYLLAFSSYIIANFSLFFASRQVTVTNA